MDYDFEAHERACLAHPLVEITEARFQEMLEILPPRKRRRGAGLETFNMMEFQVGDVTDQFARVTLAGVDRFFTRPVRDHDPSTWITYDQCVRLVDDAAVTP